MVLPWMLWAGLVLGQAPDFLDVQPAGSGYRVLAGGGLVYHWSGRGELVLGAQLGTPASALYTCEDRRGIAVGLKGQLHVTAGQAWRRSTLEGGSNLWAVAGAGCERVLIAGEGGLWQGALTGEAPVFTPLPLPTSRPLYGVATERERAVAVGADGTVLLRRRASEPFREVGSNTTAPLLAVALLGGERYVIAGAGGLWRGEAETLRRVYTEESEVFTRVVFADERRGVALGQRTVLATRDGGESWRVLPQPQLLGAVSIGDGRFLGVGHDGAWVMLDTAEPAPAASAPREAPRRPGAEGASPPSAGTSAGTPPASTGKPPASVRPETPPPPAGPQCVLAQSKENMGGAFIDVKRAGDRLWVVGSDGTVREAREKALTVAFEAKEPLLGLAVSADASGVAAVGHGVMVRSSDGGRSFHARGTPAEGVVYAAAFSGDRLMLFDANGRGWRELPGERFEELTLPRKVTYFGASFADARRGYVVGECGTLLETLDGGSSWKALTAPTPQSLQGVLAVGETLYVSGVGGVWRSDDRGRGFQHVLDTGMCVRLAREGAAVAAACAGGMGTVLRYAADGRDFQPVPVPYSHALLSVELLPGGEIIAVGVREQFIRARPSGGALAHDSKALREWKAFVDKHHQVREQAPPKDPARRVAVAPLPKP